MNFPIADRISQWNTATEIIFKCPKCGTSFAFFGDKEKYCHNCGNKINWDNVPKYISKDFSNKYFSCDNYEEKQEMLEYINAVIAQKQDGDKDGDKKDN